MTEQSTEPTLTGVRNFRDLGGIPTVDGRRLRHGVLFRSGHLAHATAEDIAFLQSLRLHTVFDFRNSADQALDGPDASLANTRNVNIPLSDPAEGADFWRMVHRGDSAQLRSALSDGQGADRMTASYRAMVHERTAEHSQVLHAMAEDSVPALLHCAAGKDRAGLSIAITLLALGVHRDAIEADYLASNSPHRRYKLRRAKEAEGDLPTEVVELLAPLFDARPGYLAAAYTAIDQQWGDVETYLEKGLKLTPGTRDRLRDRLLEG